MATNKLQIVESYLKGVSPPIMLSPLAEKLGLEVYKVDGWDNDISGKIVKDEDKGGSSGYAIYVNAKHGLNRRRFTIAHEIAHYVLHQPLIGDGILDDALYRSGLNHHIEIEANQLAADILMPWNYIREKLRL